MAVKRRARCADTDKQRLARICERHLRDLKRAHGKAPPDVALPPPGRAIRIAPAPVSSFCTSPSELCAELMS